MPIDHEGLYVQRLQHPCHQTDREKALHDTWIRENEESQVLARLLNPHVKYNALGVPEQKKPDRWPTQEEATLAATVIQWLGTHVGFDFLTRALKDAGYKVVLEKKP